MELRRRRGDAVNDARGSNVEASISGTISDDSKGKTEDSVHDGGFTPSSSEAADAVVGAAVRGGSLLMVLALVQRASTFVLNVLLHRAMLSAESDGDDDLRDKTGRRATSALEAYGAAAITLELISSTALFLAREPFRVALARSRAPAEAGGVGRDGEGGGGRREREEKQQQQQQQQQRRRFVNTAWLSAPVGLAFAAFVQLAYPWIIRNDAFYGVEENRRAASLMCMAAAMELMCEPLALIFQYRLLVDVRVRAEAAAVLVLGVSRYLLVTRAGTGILSFGYAQLLHSATLATAYVFFAARDVSRGAQSSRTNGVSNTLEASESLARQMASGASGSSLPSSASESVSVVTPAAVSPAAATTPPIAGSTAATTPARPTPPPAADDRGGFSSVWGWLPSRPARRNDDHTAEELVDGGHLRLARALAGQSLLKHVLTEGDKIVLARATAPDRGGSGGGGGGQGGSLHEQGVYAMASGYGSLAARLLFQPVEEAARLMFSKLGVEGVGADAVEMPTGAKLATGEMGAAPGQGAGRGQDIGIDNGKGSGRDTGNDNESDSDVGCGGDGGREARTRMAALLATLLKLVLTAGLVFVCFGFHYTETLMRLLLAGKRGGGGGDGESGGTTSVTEVSRVLSWYCVYVLFLAANGMCEAFSSAVARGSQLTGMGAGLVVSFIVFWALVGPLTSRFGTRGLVMANASGMACRVVCSATFIRRFFLHQAPTDSTLRHRQHQRHRSSEYSPQATAMSAATSATPPHNDGRPVDKNLWRQVVSGALPHPCVAAAMVASSAVAHAASPSGGGGDASGIGWEAARHVALGGVCFVATALVFTRYEGVFLREMKALWAARRRGGGGAGGKDGTVAVTRTAGGVGPLSSGAVGVRNKTD